MFKKWFVSIVVSGLFLISVHVSNVLAGVEPSPFQPEINQLGAVANILESAEYRIVNTMFHPPDPCMPPEPCKGLNGAVNRLEAIDNQVSSAGNMVYSMINEVMGFEPMPFRVEDLVLPLEAVRGVAEVIVGEIYLFMDTNPDSQAPEFLDALGQVSGSAILLIETVDHGIRQFSGGPTECCDIYEETECSMYDECSWVVTAATPDGFCTESEY